MKRRGRPLICLDFPQRLLKEYKAGVISGNDIARRYRVSLAVALRELRRAGLDAFIRRGRHALHLDFTPTLLRDYAAGVLNHEDVARRCHVSPQTALRELRRAGLDTSVRTRCRLCHAASPQVAQRNARVLQRYQQGYSLREIGEECGLTREGVRQVLLRHGVVRRPRGRSCA